MHAAGTTAITALVVTNRGAGLHARKCDPTAILQALEAMGYATRWLECKQERTITEVRNRLSPRPAVVVVAGGDGTLNLTANALAQTGIPLCIVPCGTANDLAGSLEIPSTLGDALSLIRYGAIREIDLGWVNGRFFLNVASLGMSAKVAHAIRPETKRRWGKWAYAREFIRQVRRRPVEPLQVCVDETCERFEAYQVSIANGQQFGGGWRVAHDSELDDELLDVVVVTKGPLRFRRNHQASKALEQIADRTFHTRRIDIEADHSLQLNVDGEPLRMRPPLYFRVYPKALRVFVPLEEEGDRRHQSPNDRGLSPSAGKTGFRSQP
jgi:YegS/Rv2252/BmrU family lipid kinase